MELFIFAGALAAAVLVFELLSAAQVVAGGFGKESSTRLSGAQVNSPANSVAAVPPRRSTWDAILIALLPTRFDPEKNKRANDVISLNRRAGYPYKTTGEFYAAAMRTFSIYLFVGGMMAGALFFLKLSIAAPAIAVIFIVLGLRRPYVRLKMLAKKRAEAMTNNMHVGLAVLYVLIDSGLSVLDALQKVGEIGGPFCNLCGFLQTQLTAYGSDDYERAIEVTRQHLPDPSHVEANLFLNDVLQRLKTGREILPGIKALHQAVHRQVVEETEARAALVRQRAGLFGVFAVLGLVLAIIAPFLGAF